MNFIQGMDWVVYGAIVVKRKGISPVACFLRRRSLVCHGLLVRIIYWWNLSGPEDVVSGNWHIGISPRPS